MKTKTMCRLLAAAFACTFSAVAQSPLLTNAANSLISREDSFLGGWAWQSVEQAPNYQGDSDVGTSSVGIAFLEAYNATGDVTYLSAAEEAGNWLVSAQTATGWVPDYYNPGNVSPSGPANYGFTSMDDGAIGQALFLYSLYQKTGNTAYESAATKAANWLVSYALAPSGETVTSECYWYWWVPSSNGTTVYLGLGSGVAGIFYGLDKLSQLTGNATYEDYALAGAAWEETQIASNGSVPEQTGGGVASDTGFYQGSAGIAFAYYSLYQHTGNSRWLTDADKIMAWVRSVEVTKSSGVAWPAAIGGNDQDLTNHTSMAFGNAGIGWAELQAYKVTGATVDLQTAEAAGNWLLSIGTSAGGGTTWEEPYGNADNYTSLDLGVSGIGYFLYDLYLATGTTTYNTAAQNAAAWVSSVAFTDSLGYYWGTDVAPVGSTNWAGKYEPSRDWGTAGIASFAARISGGPDDQPRDAAALAPVSQGTQYSLSAGAGTGGSISPGGPVTVGQGMNYTFTITPNSGYTISSVTVDGTNEGAISTYTFTGITAAHTITAAFTAASATNLSQGKTATASSSYAGYPASNANDGILTTAWDARNGTYPAWWEVNLGASHTITQVVLDFFPPTPTTWKYEVQGSTNGSTWTTLVNESANTASISNAALTIPSATAHYIRIYFTGAPSSGDWAGLYECQVFGK